MRVITKFGALWVQIVMATILEGKAYGVIVQIHALRIEVSIFIGIGFLVDNSVRIESIETFMEPL